MYKVAQPNHVESYLSLQGPMALVETYVALHVDIAARLLMYIQTVQYTAQRTMHNPGMNSIFVEHAKRSRKAAKQSSISHMERRT